MLRNVDILDSFHPQAKQAFLSYRFPMLETSATVLRGKDVITILYLGLGMGLLSWLCLALGRSNAKYSIFLCSQR